LSKCVAVRSMENDSLAVDVSVGVQDSPLFWLVADSEVQLALVSVLNVERIERRTDAHLYDRGLEDDSARLQGHLIS
jgi:hypothetical protein